MPSFYTGKDRSRLLTNIGDSGHETRVSSRVIWKMKWSISVIIIQRLDLGLDSYPTILG
jgi:hypothetical protein